ncbi:MAG TPA: DUF885 domain-containing protein [Chitinophagales bacterium]|nr:DUF885 domain-containing protein [Chitinophagales bacterium]HQW79149.1 DUF885 domain-containing protein [Chitinophagales bacterium]
MKKRLSTYFILYFLCFISNGYAEENSNTSFDSYKKAFINRLWKIYPDWATNVGYHKYDSMLYVPNGKQRKIELNFYTSELEKLQAFSYNTLSDANKIDFKILEDFYNYGLWQINQYKSWQWNPADYNIGSSFSIILSENYAPLKKRLTNVFIKLKNVPQYYEAAKQNIQNPSAEHLQLAIDQNEGSLSVFETDYVIAVKKMNFYPETEALYLKRGADAVAAIQSYIQFLKDFKNITPRSFRLGKELYSDKFKYEIQSAFTSDEIYEAAINRKIYLHQEMGKIAKSLWPKYFGNLSAPENDLFLIRKIIDTISMQHVKAADFQTEIEKQIPALTTFVKEKNLIYLDPKKPLKVRKEPAYMAGVAGASISSPGPYAKNGTTYYNVGSIENWTAERQESYLREYNQYILQILNIHEAIPGHYVQLVYSNKSPSIIKSIFGNGAMIEGWAVYSELMMMENGYGYGIDSSEFWLMYYKWNLRTVCNTILDIGVHTKNLSEKDAMDLLINQAFQQQTEAEGKWRRVQVTNVQLTSYFTGFYEILQLRDHLKEMQGNAFNVKKFNEQFLKYGSSPVKFIKEILLKK